mmetsp:Transcript_12141/g.34761  ORF Transcript_12141/g.34761 Transcript_12141/m.34761 type:complete len:372 (+) Transcript_12141:796-1911(+)
MHFFQRHAEFPLSVFVLERKGRPVDIDLVPGGSVAQNLVGASVPVPVHCHHPVEGHLEGPQSELDSNVLGLGLLGNDKLELDLVFRLDPRVIALGRWCMGHRGRCGSRRWRSRPCWSRLLMLMLLLLLLKILQRLAEARRGSPSPAASTLAPGHLAPGLLRRVSLHLGRRKVDALPDVLCLVVNGPADKHVSVYPVGLAVPDVVRVAKGVPTGHHEIRRSLVVRVVLGPRRIVPVHGHRRVSVERRRDGQAGDLAAGLLLLHLEEVDNLLVAQGLDALRGLVVAAGVGGPDLVGDLLLLLRGGPFQECGPLGSAALFGKVGLGVLAEVVVGQAAFLGGRHGRDGFRVDGGDQDVLEGHGAVWYSMVSYDMV